jgi:hypothetical protein
VARVASGLAGKHREDWSSPRLRDATVRFAGDRSGACEHTSPAAAVRTLGRVLHVFAGAKPSESKDVLTAGRRIDGLLLRFAPWSREEGALDPWFEVYRGDRRGWKRVDLQRGLQLTRREALRLARKEHAKDGAWWRVYRFVPDGAGEEPGPYCLLDLLPKGELPRRCRDGVYADPPGDGENGAGEEAALAFIGGRSLRIDSKGRLDVTFASAAEAELVAGALLADRKMSRAGYIAARRGAVLLRGIGAIRAELAALALTGRRR